MVEASRAPRAPAAASSKVSVRQSEEFEAMKKSLDGLASWGLASSGWDKLPMAFTESGNEKQAKILLEILE